MMPNYMWNNEVVEGKRSLLLVEGPEDVQFFGAFLSYLEKAHVQVSAVGGKGEFRRVLQTLRLARNFDGLRNLGVLRDADDNPQGAMHSLWSAVEAANLPEPRKVGSQAGHEWISVYVDVVPGPEQPGCFETALWEMLSAPERDCIGSYLECMSNLRQVRHIDKSRLYAYLAAGPDAKDHDNGDSVPRRAKAGLRLGEAAKKGVWNWESPALGRVKELLEVL